MAVALTPRARPVRLTRPEDPRLARTAGAVWRAAPPAPAGPAPPNKRAGRPALEEPLEEPGKHDERLRLAYFLFCVWLAVVVVGLDLKYPSWRSHRYSHTNGCYRCLGR